MEVHERKSELAKRVKGRGIVSAILEALRSKVVLVDMQVLSEEKV